MINQKFIFTIVTATLLFLILTGFAISFALMYQKRRILHRKDVEQVKLRYEQELLKSQLEIQEQTFKTISQEIHDNIGQVLTLVKLQLNTHIKEVPGEKMDLIQSSHKMVGDVIADLRNLSKSLHPDRVINVGLAGSIEYELALLDKTSVINTGFEVSGTIKKLSSEKEIIIFRIFQEIMNNAIKHSQALNFKVLMVYKEQNLSITLKDDGVGFNGNDRDGSGIGLHNIRSRAALIKASLETRTARNEGVTFILALPYV